MDEEKESEREEYESPRMRRRQAHFMKHWMRHAAMVPKGYLRYQLLKKLSEKPMSGSEIMAELESETRGYWKPSPGSIYPLLAWLQDQKLITEEAHSEPGIRRYSLTDSGKTFLETEKKSREEIDRHMENLGNMWYGFRRERGSEAGRTAIEFFRAAKDLGHELRREHTKESIEAIRKTLQDATEQIREITRKLQA